MPGHHRGLDACRAVTARVSPGHSGPAGREQRCLTRAGRRRIEWPHEIPDSGISHRNAGSGPCSGTEAGDISPAFAALEHAAGDLTTLGKDPLHGGSSPPSDTQGLPTELPVSYRQNCGGDLFFSMTPGSDTGAGRCPAWPGVAAGLLRVLRAGLGRGCPAGLQVSRWRGLLVRVSRRGGSRAGWSGVAVPGG